MSVDHYENFPVASILMPRRLRKPVAAIYHFARAADDIADEGDMSNEDRLKQLDEFRAELARCCIFCCGSRCWRSVRRAG